MATQNHKPITEAELREMERCIEDANNAESTKDWIGVAEEGVIKHLPRLIAEVRRLRAALESYGVTAFWDGMGDMIWSPYTPELRSVPGWVLARRALGWPQPSEACENPACDGVKEENHRHFKDGRWLDDGSEM